MPVLTSIQMYIEDSWAMNLYLRSNDIYPLPYNQKLRTPEAFNVFQQDLITQLNTIPNFISNSASLYRGTRIPQSIFQDIITQNIYEDKAFLSTCLEKDKAFRYMTFSHEALEPENMIYVLLEISSYKTAKNVSSFSPTLGIDGDNDGTEHLFLPNTKFDIISVTYKQEYGIDYYHLVLAE